MFQHDCVIIPEFGGFVANYRPARINHETHSFMPPSKDIGFNKSLTHNDGLLISYISECRRIGYVDTKRMVSGFVKETVKKLEKGKKIVFEEVGTFHYDKQNNLQFEPDLTTNFLLDSYGLSEFSFTPLEDFDVQKRLRKKFKDKEPAGIPVRKKVIWSLVVAIPVLVALVVIPLKTDLLNFRTNVSSLNPVNTEIRDSNIEETDQPIKEILPDEEAEITEITAEAEDIGEVVEEVQPVPPETMQAEDEPQAEPIPASQYFLIAGSFKNHENAIRFNDRLVNDGYPSVVLEPENNLFRVALNSFVSKDEAIRALGEVRKNPARSDAWLLKR